jgi:cytochrome c553
MKSLKIIALIGVVMLFASAIFALESTPEERGKVLFNDTNLGGTSGKACSSCHPDGKGLEKVSSKADGQTMEQINNCLNNAHNGKMPSVTSEQMKDLLAYIKSITPKPADTQKKKAPVGC